MLAGLPGFEVCRSRLAGRQHGRTKRGAIGEVGRKHLTERSLAGSESRVRPRSGLLSRRQLFHASDLARTLKVPQQAGLTIARVEIESSGKIVITTSPTVNDDGRSEVRAELEALRRRGAERRAERLARELERKMLNEPHRHGMAPTPPWTMSAFARVGRQNSFQSSRTVWAMSCFRAAPPRPTTLRVLTGLAADLVWRGSAAVGSAGPISISRK